MSNKRQMTLTEMLNKTKELIDNGKDIKSACKEVLLNTPNVERYRAYYFQLVDDVFPELKASLDQKYFKNFKLGNKFFWEFLTDTCHTCKICGKIIPSAHEYCSKECMESDREVINKRVKETLFKNFGEDGLRCKEIAEKKKRTNLAKYGCEYASQNEDVKRKALETNKRNHDGILAMHNPLIKAKIVETNLQRYGVPYAQQLDEVKAKAKQTNLERYGYECNFGDAQKRAEYEQICIEKYGEDYAKKRAKKARFTFQLANRPHIELYEKEFVLENFIDENNEFMINEFCAFFKVSRGMCDKFKVNNNIMNRNNDWHRGRSSSIEQELFESIPCENKYQNDKTILGGMELDMVLPDIKLAIEYDGLYWHSVQQGKGENYHLDKTKRCLEKGYQLFHIFESDDIEIWQSMINNKLGLNKRIYARKCEIREANFADSMKFLEENHLQGFCPSSIRYGLYYNDELVQLITFGKSRFDKSYDYELLRLCTLKGYCVVGGASKLFKHALKFVKGNIISYANRRFSCGEIYKQLGFELKGESAPNYFYNKSGKMYSRIAFQKHKLKDVLDKFDDSLSEYDNMLNNGYDKIYDCGNLVFSYKN
jgi:predicted nucleic acid-binding Zn ribbon protein